MILTDAGPLVAILVRTDPDHESCVRTLDSLTYPMLTTWPAFTEAMYLLGRRVGWKLWEMLRRGDIEIAALDEKLLQRTHHLMERYRDRPMDLADATLVAVAEARGLVRVFTLDADFHIYRIKGRRTFDIVPERP